MSLDKDRIVTCDAELVTTPIPPSPNGPGGLEVSFCVDKNVLWKQRVQILLRPRPWYLPKFLWHWIYKTWLIQSTNYNA
jgi:hypothetical protein